MKRAPCINTALATGPSRREEEQNNVVGSFVDCLFLPLVLATHLLMLPASMVLLENRSLNTDQLTDGGRRDRENQVEKNPANPPIGNRALRALGRHLAQGDKGSRVRVHLAPLFCGSLSVAPSSTGCRDPGYCCCWVFIPDCAAYSLSLMASMTISVVLTAADPGPFASALTSRLRNVARVSEVRSSPVVESWDGLTDVSGSWAVPHQIYSVLCVCACVCTTVCKAATVDGRKLQQ